MGHAPDVAPRRLAAQRRLDAEGRRSPGALRAHQSLGVRQSRDERREHRFHRVPHSRREWCGWGAWDAVRRGTGQVLLALRRACVAGSFQGRFRVRWRGGDQRWVVRAQCLRPEPGCRCQAPWQRELQWAPCRPGGGPFAASPCGALAVRAGARARECVRKRAGLKQPGLLVQEREWVPGIEFPFRPRETWRLLLRQDRLAQPWAPRMGPRRQPGV